MRQPQLLKAAKFPGLAPHSSFSIFTPIYTQLSDRHVFSNANKMMAALSRVLGEAWKLGQMSAEDYHRAIASSTDATAIAIKRKTGQRLLKGRGGFYDQHFDGVLDDIDKAVNEFTLASLRLGQLQNDGSLDSIKLKKISIESAPPSVVNSFERHV